MENSPLVRKHNKLIKAPYSTTLKGEVFSYTALQIKIFNFFISQIYNNEEAIKKRELSFDVSFLMNCLSFPSRNTEFLKETTRGMFGAFEEVEIDSTTGKKITTQTGVFEKIIYDETADPHKITVIFTPSGINFISDLVSNYTVYYFDNIKRLKSEYAIKIYELCKQHRSSQISVLKYTLEEFRYYLSIKENQYKIFADIKRYVIQKIEQEINEKTDISIQITPIKTKRKVTHIYINFQEKKEQSLIEIPTDENQPQEEPDENWQKCIDLLTSKGIKGNKAIKLCELASSNYDFLEQELNKEIERVSRQEGIKNIEGMVINNLENVILTPSALANYEREQKEKEEAEQRELALKVEKEAEEKAKEAKKEKMNKAKKSGFFIDLWSNNDEFKNKFIQKLEESDKFMRESIQKSAVNISKTLIKEMSGDHFNQLINESVYTSILVSTQLFHFVEENLS